MAGNITIGVSTVPPLAAQYFLRRGLCLSVVDTFLYSGILLIEVCFCAFSLERTKRCLFQFSSTVRIIVQCSCSCFDHRHVI